MGERMSVPYHDCDCECTGVVLHASCSERIPVSGPRGRRWKSDSSLGNSRRGIPVRRDGSGYRPTPRVLPPIRVISIIPPIGELPGPIDIDGHMPNPRQLGKTHPSPGTPLYGEPGPWRKPGVPKSGPATSSRWNPIRTGERRAVPPTTGTDGPDSGGGETPGDGEDETEKVHGEDVASDFGLQTPYGYIKGSTTTKE